MANCSFICSDTGIGDHGLDGIKRFLNVHKCANMCKSLAFIDYRNEEGQDGTTDEDEDDE